MLVAACTCVRSPERAVSLMSDFGRYVDGGAWDWIFLTLLDTFGSATKFVDDGVSLYAEFDLIAKEMRCVQVTIILIEGSVAGSLTDKSSPDSETRDWYSISLIDRDYRFGRERCDSHGTGLEVVTLESLSCSPGQVEQLTRDTSPDH